MKKLVYSLAVLFTVALVSCSGNKAEGTDTDTMPAEDTTIVAEGAEVVDSNNDTAAAVEVAEVVEPAADSAAK